MTTNSSAPTVRLHSKVLASSYHKHASFQHKTPVQASPKKKIALGKYIAFRRYEISCSRPIKFTLVSPHCDPSR